MIDGVGRDDDAKVVLFAGNACDHVPARTLLSPGTDYMLSRALVPRTMIGQVDTRELIAGRPVLLVIDVQEGSFVSPPPHWEHLVMPGSQERMRRIRLLVDAARDAGLPVIFIQEVHRPNMVDFGRELDGDEPVHCVEGNPMTPVAAQVLGLRATDHVVRKRRYSAFFGTELSMLLREVGADTLVLTGGFTDVCVHYTFVDALGDYLCRVVEDCVTGSSLAAHKGAIAAMEHLQPGTCTTADAIIREFQRQPCRGS